MEQPNVTHSTFVIERTYPAAPERVFAAFADPAKKRRWYADGHATSDTEAFEMDFRVGGQERTVYRMNAGTPFPGAILESDGAYQDIVPNRRVVIANTMTLSGHRFSASLITAEFLPAENGTNLIFTHQGAFFEGSDGPQMREAGWRKLLDHLAESLAG